VGLEFFCAINSKIECVFEARLAMQFKVSSDRVVFLLLAVLPLLFMPLTIFIDGWKAKILFDVLFVLAAMVLLFCLPRGGRGYIENVKILWLLFVVYVIWFFVKLLIAKYFSEVNGYFYWVPYLREAKPALYILFSALVISRWGIPSLDAFVRAGIIFSCLVLISFFIGVVIKGGGRPEVIDEANYDNFLVLIGYLASIVRFGPRLDWRFLLFLSATLVSQSKTGVVCFFVLTAIYSIKDFGFKTVLQLFAGVIVVGSVIILRMSNIESVEDVDRFRMWLSYIDLIKDSTVNNLFFGFIPGEPLRYTDPYIGWFIKFQSEERLNILGLHAFNYHGMWLRLMCTWGVIPILLLGGVIIKRMRKTKSSVALLLLVVIQGVGMGVFYLSTVSVPMILFIISVNHYHHLKEEKSHVN